MRNQTPNLGTSAVYVEFHTMACSTLYKTFIVLHINTFLFNHFISRNFFGQLGGLNFVIEIKEREKDPKLCTKVCSQINHSAASYAIRK